MRWRSRRAAFRDASIPGLPLDHASKFYLYAATKGDQAFNVGLVLRSDHEPNVVKFKNLLAVDTLELMPIEQAEALSGAKSGFIGPVDLDVPMYVDASLDGAFNLTCGGNRTDYHHFGFKPDRDVGQFKGFHDLRLAKEGDACPRCGAGHYQAFRGIEVGQVFKLGTKYSVPMNCVFLDEAGGRAANGDGVLRHRHHAYGGRGHRAEPRRRRHCLAVAGGAIPGAPARARCGKPEIAAAAENIERASRGGRVRGFYDDRTEVSPGVKFKDADLLGMPLRLTVGARGLKDGIVELRDRTSKEVMKVAPDAAVDAVTAARDRIMTELGSRFAVSASS